jgi:hypothetical protein
VRPLDPLLQSIMIGDTERRSPAFRVEIYDIRSTADGSINDVVAGIGLGVIAGPHDFSNFASQIRVDEKSSDYVGGGIAANSATVTIEDPDGGFNPLSLMTDTSSSNLARYFRRGNVVRIYEGDEAVDSSLWPNTMTGTIKGQPGYVRSRALGATGQSQLTFKVISREADFLGYERTSREYTAGETYLTIGTDVAVSEMGLGLAEIEFSGWGTTRVLRHSTMTLTGESPISLLARVMFVDGFVPKFTGEGKLSQHLAVLGGNIDRYYANERTIVAVEWPMSDIQVADTVAVKGLDFNLSKSRQPFQVVAKVDITTGFFADNERIDAFYADDKTQLAENSQLVVVESVNGGFKALGGGESAVAIPAINDAVEGEIGMTISVDTGYAPWLATVILVLHVSLAAIPDQVLAFGGGFTISVGRIIQAFSLAAGLWLMNSLGRGKYEIWADPFEYVFCEIRQEAASEEAAEFSENRIEVLNHLIDDDATAIVLAREILFMEAAKLHPRSVKMATDIGLEPADVWSSTLDDRIYLVTGISRTLKRDSSSVLASVTALEITSGIEVT